MTWLSISLKNAAACDKWYQLQNHFITESLNANGAWEKPFVGHPRACHTQCRTNKKKKHKKGNLFFLSLCFFFKTRVRAQARRGFLCFPRGRLAWCLLCRVRSFARAFPSREAGAAKQNFFKKRKKTLRFFLIFKKLKNLNILFLFLFTDLSMAGLPAELKHITQRRKRKQP